jgi:hypothetical protein
MEAISIDEIQKEWIENQNTLSDFRVVVFKYEQNYAVDASILTAEGYEEFATYFNGASVTEIEMTNPLEIQL